MCGLAGHNTTKQKNFANDAILAQLAHRGPDAQAHWGEEGIDLYHSRLSIIDTDERANQPFHDNSGRYVLVFNGEIYNFQHLKAGLSYPWQTQSDTEVLLALLIQKGVEALALLEGMFALAFYDRQEQNLLLARDRFGKKPLYVHQGEHSLSFASEVRVLMRMHPYLNRVSTQQVSNWLFWQTIPGGTLIEGIEELAPGSYDYVKAGQMISQGSYVPENPYAGISISSEEALKEVKNKVTTAVEKRLVSDVPFAAFLSGGVDSSIITAIAGQRLGKDLHTFTVSFDESDFSEHHIAAEVAKRYQSQHHEIRLNPQDFLDLLPEGLAATDHPSGDGLNTYVVSKHTQAAGFKMALSGIGGDEWFLGYPYFRRMSDWQKRSWLSKGAGLQSLLPFDKRKGMEIASAVSKFGGNAYAFQRLLFDQTSIEDLFHLDKPTLFPSADKGPFSQAVYSQQEWQYYTQPVLLRDSDQYSMAVGLELRAPFMDADLVDYALALSDDLKLGTRPKDLLISAFASELPRSVYDRQKQGFTLPWEHWIKNELRGFCQSRIMNFSDRLDTPDLLPEWNRFLQGKSKISWSRWWSVVALEDWMERNGIDVIN
ncbi:MAG: asparagine synthase (glutamine-hydrolyzing) [Flavobacteriia bacterium]